MAKEDAILVGLLAVAAPYFVGKMDPSMSHHTEFFYQILMVLVAVVIGFIVLRVFTKSCCRCTFMIIPVLVVVSAPFALQMPGASEALIHLLVDKAGLPTDIFKHLKVKDESVWYDIVTKGNLGIAEAYMHGKAEVEPFDLFVKLLNGTSVGTRRKQSVDALSVFGDLVAAPLGAVNSIFNMQTKVLSKRVTEQHYDAGNDLYEKMLGPSMSYTCAYWKDAKTLDEAQFAKFNLIFRKLQIPNGSAMKMADLGMGWGTLAKYVHEHAPPGSSVTGVSLSKEQVSWASANLAKDGLKFIHADYRDHCADPKIQGTYDRVYSVGMLEHVGFKNHAGFFRCVKMLLKPDGLAVVHTIGEPDFVPISDAFLEKYIFPGAVIPTLSSLTAAFENLFILEDFQNFGHDYAPTLAAWNVNAEKFFKENPKAYTLEFQRMWHYYLKLCEALFELRINQLWHFVLSPRPTYRLGIERQS
jgi:cyclopropane-fatty-acyl-phospholipid synthase